MPINRFMHLSTTLLISILLVATANAETSQRDLAGCNSTNWAKVIAACSALIKADSLTSNEDKAAALSNRAAAYLNKMRFEESLTDATKAVKLDPANINARFNLAAAQLQLGKFKEAVSNYSKVIKLKPKLADASYGKTLSLYYLGYLEDAEAEATRASTQITNKDARKNFKELLAEIGRTKANPISPLDLVILSTGNSVGSDGVAKVTYLFDSRIPIDPSGKKFESYSSRLAYLGERNPNEVKEFLTAAAEKIIRRKFTKVTEFLIKDNKPNFIVLPRWVMEQDVATQLQRNSNGKTIEIGKLSAFSMRKALADFESAKANIQVLSSNEASAPPVDYWDNCTSTDFDLSIQACTTIINSGNESKENHAMAFTNRGIAYDRKGEYSLALADYDNAITLDPNSGNAFFNRGLLYGHERKYDSAIADFDKTIALNPKDAEAYFNRAISYSFKGEPDLAITDFDLAISLNPKYADAYNYRGNAFTRKKDYVRAMADYDMAISLNPKYADAYNNRGVAYVETSKLNLALTDFKLALTNMRSSDPQYSTVQKNMADAEKKMGMESSASGVAVPILPNNSPPTKTPDSRPVSAMTHEETIAAANGGNAEAQTKLGRMYDAGQGVPQNNSEAAKWYQLAAKHGFAEAQNIVGTMYQYGQDVAQNDGEAVRWYRLSADQGFAPAQLNLGIMYQNGTGVEKNEAEALRWYQLAVNQGFAPAQTSLGNMYSDGRGVKKDYALAMKWYLAAAGQKQVEAQYNIGVMYEYGQGVTKNIDEAAKWYGLAAKAGSSDAKIKLRDISGLNANKHYSGSFVCTNEVWLASSGKYIDMGGSYGVMAVNAFVSINAESNAYAANKFRESSSFNCQFADWKKKGSELTVMVNSNVGGKIVKVSSGYFGHVYP